MLQESSQTKQTIRKCESLTNTYHKLKLTNQKVSLLPIFFTISQVKFWYALKVLQFSLSKQLACKLPTDFHGNGSQNDGCTVALVNFCESINSILLIVQCLVFLHRWGCVFKWFFLTEFPNPMKKSREGRHGTAETCAGTDN